MFIAGRDVFAQLDLYHVEFRFSDDGMLAARLHCNNVTGFDGLLHPVNNRFAAAADHRPYFITAVMAVVVHMMPRAERDFDRHAFFFHVKHAEIPPGLLGKHDLLIQLVHIRFDVGTGFLVGNQNAV